MIFYIQCNTRLDTIEVSPEICIGQLCYAIFDKLQIRPKQTILMIHQNQILGLPPLNFGLPLKSCGFAPISLIFIVLNHFPDISNHYGFSTSPILDQWLAQQTSSIDDSHIFYDPILRRSRQTERSQPSREYSAPPPN